ncbi:MAG: peptidase MA family metallohydrolase [Chlorobiota bacterium]
MKFIKSFIILSIALLSTASVYSQFGKNRVQYQEFEWKFIETKHFDIYFHQGGEYLAKFTAVEAERALQSIESNLKYNMKMRISFIVFNSHNQFQQNNIINSFLSENVGGVTQLFKNRIVVPYQGDYEQFRHVVHHELVHGVLNDMFHGGTLQSSLRNQGYFIPGWLNEGLCEYLSNDGMDTQTDIFMRDVTISESLPELQRISGYAKYRVGQTFYWYIADKYGKEKVADFINRLNIHKNLEIAFKSSFDMSLEEFNEMWERDIKRIYWPDLEKFKALPEIADRITKRKKIGNFYNSAPAISPNGDKMAFISEQGGVFVVAVMEDLDDMTSIRPLVSSFRRQDFEDLNMLTPGISWNPEGDKIAISAKSGGQDAVFITDVETGAYDKLTWGLKSISSVTWSPNGEKLAFIATDDEKSDIYVYDIDSEELKNLTNDLFTDELPAWAPDSESIYFISDRGSKVATNIDADDLDMWDYNYGKNDIYKIDIESTKIERLTDDVDNRKTSVAVASDESKLLYISDKNGIGNIYSLDLESLESRPLTNSLQGITQLSLARDDSKVLFGTQIDGGYDIFSIEYPFDINLDVESLPLTDYRKTQAKRDSLIREINNKRIDTLSNKEDDQLISYGDFNIDFENQEIVKPNQKVQIVNSGEDEVYDENFRIKDYKLKFSPDIILANPGYSTFFGAQGSTQMLFSDELGNHQLYFQANLLIDLRNSNFYGAYSYLPGIIDYRFSGFHNAGFTSPQIGSVLRFRSYGGAVSAQYPFDLFNRAELNLTWYNLSRTDIVNAGAPSLTRTLIVPEFKYVHDDVLFGLYGPRDGTRYNFTVSGSPNIFSDGLEFFTFETDIRTYHPLSDFIGFAFKFTSGASFGDDAQQFYLGGTDNWLNRSFRNGRLPFNEPEDFAFMNFKYPMRGYSIAANNGNKYFLTNAEFRFPMLTALVAGPLPILIQGVMGAVFLDVGAAWDDNFNPTNIVDPLTFRKEYDDLMISSGLGIRSYVLGLPLKIDIAWAKTYDNWSVPQYLFSLGYDF